jgi:hypothetical protein
MNQDAAKIGHFCQFCNLNSGLALKATAIWLPLPERASFLLSIMV